MIERNISLNEAMHLEPLTELALKRYSLKETNGELTFDALGQDAAKDIQFVVDLIKFYSHPDDASLQDMDQYSLGGITHEPLF